MKKINTSQILVMAATLLTLLVNILANALPLNGQTTGEVSDQFEVYFVPAGYVFAIWGIIYLGLLAYTWYQARADQADNPRLKQISRLYVGSCGRQHGLDIPVALSPFRLDIGRDDRLAGLLDPDLPEASNRKASSAG